MYEARFLAGMVAGAMTKNNKIGYAAALPTSEVVRGIDAFGRGVASVHPEAKVHVEWIGKWYDPPRERDVTFSLIDRGATLSPTIPIPMPRARQQKRGMSTI